MKVYYDKKHSACAMEFDGDDTIFMETGKGKIRIYSCKGGKPEIIEKQLLYEHKDVEKGGGKK